MGKIITKMQKKNHQTIHFYEKLAKPRQGKRPKVHAKQKGLKNFFKSNSIYSLCNGYPRNISKNSQKFRLNLEAMEAAV